MTHDWSLREEILIATHRWPVIILFGLVGVLLAWIISFMYPSQYRAKKELYVGINIYSNAASDTIPTGANMLQFTNADDFKNWQMANLDSLVKLDENINDTLLKLQAIDSYWDSVKPEELRAMLHVYWRNAGKWRLVADHNDPLRATQAVTTWEQVVIERIHTAIDSAQNAMKLDLELQSTIDLQNEIMAQIAGQSQIRASFYDWQLQASQWSKQEPVDQTIRQQIEGLIYQLNVNAVRENLLEDFPPPQAHASEYITYLQRAISILDQEILTLQGQSEALEKKKNALVDQFAATTAHSLGLSGNLVVDQVTNAPAEITSVRPSGVLILVGGALGIILWALIWTAKIVKKHQISQEAPNLEENA
jgi:hypothetical protein